MSDSTRPAFSRPLVSIGIPTFESAPFVRETLASLAAQTYANLEVIISDDGSSDATANICEAFVEGDPRFRLARHPRRGERHNFNRVLGAARGSYFMWAADHDLWSPAYVAACVAALEANRGAVLAYAHSRLIDADGAELELMDDEMRVEQPTPFRRYVTLIWRPVVCNAIYGVVRREALVRTGGYGPTPGPDHLVLAKLALQGTFVQLPEVMYFRRQNRPPETAQARRLRQPGDLDPKTAATWMSAKPGDYYRALRDAHLRVVLRSRMSATQKARACASTLSCFESRFGVESRATTSARLIGKLLPRSVRRRALGRR